MTGTVKALEWRDLRGDGSLAAGTVFDLVYVVSPTGWGFRNYPELFPVDGIEAAKAAAQADYERRVLSALTASASEPQTGRWSYSINYGPDGEENWANLITPQGDHVANIRTHHAQAIVAGLNASPAPANGQVPVSAERTYYTEGKDCPFYEALSDKDFAWEATKIAQDLVDMDTLGLEEILPFVGVLSSAAARIERLSSPVPASEPEPVAWQYRYIRETDGKPTEWREGKGASVSGQPGYEVRAVPIANPVPTPDGAVAVSMTPEEHRLEDLKQMAAYSGPIVSFECREPYYLASCDHCGWVGSSELCGTDSFGDDSDVYCPRCHSSGADCGKVAETLSAALSHPADGWRDIESAPKDGTPVDLWAAPYTGRARRFPNYWWLEQEKVWRTDCRVDDLPRSFTPRFWRPIPAAPLDAKAERE